MLQRFLGKNVDGYEVFISLEELETFEKLCPLLFIFTFLVVFDLLYFGALVLLCEYQRCWGQFLKNVLSPPHFGADYIKRELSYLVGGVLHLLIRRQDHHDVVEESSPVKSIKEPVLNLNARVQELAIIVDGYRFSPVTFRIKVEELV